MQSKLDLINIGSPKGCDLNAKDLALKQIYCVVLQQIRDEHAVPVAQPVPVGLCLKFRSSAT